VVKITPPGKNSIPKKRGTPKPVPKSGRGPKQRESLVKAKLAFVERIKQGASVPDACAAAGRSRWTYEKWRREDLAFRAAVDAAKEKHKAGTSDFDAPLPFDEFSERYLNQPLYWHQRQWWDLLEGRAPRDLDPAEVYEPGDPGFIMVNTPPEHAKSTTLSVNYVTYRVCVDPNVRIILISKTAERAKEFLYAIKTRLTHPRYSELQARFAPSGGWKEDSEIWTADRIYLGKQRDSGEKDPTVQALGIGGQLYGSRADLIICDDCIVLSNAHEYEKQIRWVQQEAITRLGPTGKFLWIGTRVDATDFSSEARDPERYPSGLSPWTYLAQPAVLGFGETPAEWRTLWPKATVPWSNTERPDVEGMYPRWDGPHLSRRRGMINPKTWALAYMQASVSEDAVFDAIKVRSCVNGMRYPGPMVRGQVNVRADGMDGLYLIGSMDPAMVGDTGVIVYAVDRHSRMRYVLDVKLKTSATPAWIRQTIRELTDQYRINEWRIERNAFQSFLTQDEELNGWLASRGVRLAEHTTGKNKWDAGFGVASMAVLFEQKLIELPSTSKHEPCRQLVEQLVAWSPETKAKTDLVMALWFAEIRAREVCTQSAMAGEGGRYGGAFTPNSFLTRRSRRQQTIVNLNDLAALARG